MARDGRIDINLYHGAVSRCKALEKSLDEKEALLIKFFTQYHEMKERAEKAEAELAALKGDKHGIRKDD